MLQILRDESIKLTARKLCDWFPGARRPLQHAMAGENLVQAIDVHYLQHYCRLSGSQCVVSTG